MALGDGSTWDEANPTNSTIANQIDDYNRDLRAGIRGRMALEHLWPSSQTGTDEGGQHTFLTFQIQTGAPTVTGGGLWVKSSGLDLWFTDSAGTDRQVCLLSTGAQTFSGAVTIEGSATFGIAPVITVSATGTTSCITYAQMTAAVPPTGSIVMYGVTGAPTGWYACTGGAVDTSSDAALFAVIASDFGVGGSGAGEFNVPDFRVRFPFGAYGSTDSAGRAMVGDANAISANIAGTADTITNKKQTTGGTTGGSITPGNTDFMPPYLAVNFIIKR